MCQTRNMSAEEEDITDRSKPLQYGLITTTTKANSNLQRHNCIDMYEKMGEFLIVDSGLLDHNVWGLFKEKSILVLRDQHLLNKYCASYFGLNGFGVALLEIIVQRQNEP